MEFFSFKRNEILAIAFNFGGLSATESHLNSQSKIIFSVGPPTFHIKFDSSKNIDIKLIYGVKSIKIGSYAQIWAYGFWILTHNAFTLQVSTGMNM